MTDIVEVLPKNSIPVDPNRYQMIPIIQIRPSPHQARKRFDEESLKRLAESMKMEGLIEPIVVRRFSPSPLMGEGRDGGVIPPPSSSPTGGEESRFELVSGERRLRAAMMLGWEMIEAKVIQTVSEGEAAAKTLIENIQREDLDPIEEAESFHQLNHVDPDYWTQEKIAEVAGRSKTYINRSFALLGLPDTIQEKLRARTFSRSHAIELTRLPTKEQQLRVAEQIPGRLTWEETRALVDSIVGLKNKPNDKSETRNPQSEMPPDPLADLWSKVALEPAFGPFGSWGVGFGSKPVATAGKRKVIYVPSWNFWVMANTPNPRQDLAQWFRTMADTLAHPSA